MNNDNIINKSLFFKKLLFSLHKIIMEIIIGILTRWIYLNFIKYLEKLNGFKNPSTPALSDPIVDGKLIYWV